VFRRRRDGDQVSGWRRLFAWRVDRHASAPVTWQTSSRDSVPHAQMPGPDPAPDEWDWPMEGGPGGAMASVYCTRCGRPNPEDARFCSNCGTPLVRGAAERPGETTSTISLDRGQALEVDLNDEPLADPAMLEALPVDAALLVVYRGPNAGSRFLLDSELTTAGRHPDSDIFLDDVTVSRRHAEFYRSGTRFTVRDVGSLNGTYVNRDRIEETELFSGDEVQIGKFRLIFMTHPRLQGQRRGGSAQDYA
jgi:hypothetical protein